jgi:hypothetical protein
MTRRNIVGAWILLTLLTLGELYSLYSTVFFLWMTAYYTTNLDHWRNLVYIWLAVSLLIGLLWIVLVVWLLQKRRKTA